MRMRIDFIKHARGWHSIEVRERRSGPDVRRRPRETGPHLPHDLAHAAVESALSIDHGFWAAFNRGATFDAFEPLEPARHLRSGLKVLRTLGEREQHAELVVSWAHRVWSGQRTVGEGLGRCPLDEASLAVTGRALDAAHAHWRETPEGGRLTWLWR